MSWHGTGEWQAFHDHFAADFASRKISPKLYPFAGRQHDKRASHWFFKEMTIGRNHGQGRAVIPTEFVNSGIGPVQHSQAIGTGRHWQDEMTLAVDDHLITQEAHVPVTHVLHVNQLVVGIKITVLQHNGEIEFTPGQVQGFFIRVGYDDQASQALVNLLPRLLMGMGMVHVGAGRVVHAEFIDIATARRDIVHGVSIHVLWHMQTMPMDDVGFGQIVFEVKANFLAFLQKEHGT